MRLCEGNEIIQRLLVAYTGTVKGQDSERSEFAWCHLARAAGTGFARLLADSRVINRCRLCILYIMILCIKLCNVNIQVMYCIVYFAFKLCLCMTSLEVVCEGSRVCHHCYAKRNDLLSDVNVELKSGEKGAGR